MTERDVTDAALAAERDTADLRFTALEDDLAASQQEILSLKADIVGLQARINELLGAATKPIPEGIFTRQSLNPLGTSTIQVHWKDVEAVRGTFDFSGLDDVLGRAPGVCRIRPYVGVASPGWALQLGNGPIPYFEPQGSTTTQVPDIWSAAYQGAVEAFYAALAERYDDDDRVGVVFASGAMTYYAEPLIRGTTNADNRAHFLAAGYTKDKDALAQTWQLDIMRVFTRTNIGLAYNPWQHIAADGTSAQSVPFMAQVMDHHISTFGARTILQNNSIRSSYVSNPPSFYNEFVLRPQAAHQFQCAAASRVGDEALTIRWAIDVLGASGIEHSGTLTAAQYAAFDAEMKGA